ncbi:MAG TPA: TIM barrel protein [Spirochaetota bacterium]|nr:MAG: endonuclease IV [Spirochaetes bacterium ADurb.Bin133]HPY86686.1 TIM barrel protein [Spirochaetota bacterium]HQB60434.1 TIM barrel protein [Spirochaetota bacterium]
MNSYGLKLWSTNKGLIKEAVELHREKYCDYIELYALNDTYETIVNHWKRLDIPFTIHAPHFGNGLNLSKKESSVSNRKILDESKRCADALDADFIIIHPGVEGDVNETIRQIKENYDSRMIIENKPYLGLLNDMVCVGKTVEEIDMIMKNCGVGFCLDIGHAICSANYQKRDYLEYLKEFIALSPTMYHLTDGDFKSYYDSHLHYGEGSYPLDKIASIIPKNSKITNEARKNSTKELNDFRKDMTIIKKIFERDTNYFVN